MRGLPPRAHQFPFLTRTLKPVPFSEGRSVVSRAAVNRVRAHSVASTTPAWEESNGLLLNGPLALYYSFDIAPAMQNAYDVKSILFQQIVNADGLEADNRPRPKVLKLRDVRMKRGPIRGCAVTATEP